VKSDQYYIGAAVSQDLRAQLSELVREKTLRQIPEQLTVLG